MDFGRTWRGALFRLSLAALAVACAPPVQATETDMLFDSLATRDFSRARLDAAELRQLDPGYLPLLRGVIFGRHGRVFQNRFIQTWLEAQPWYRPDPAFTNASLDDTERANLDSIREAEAEQHARIEPGDLRWWQDRRMTSAALGVHTGTEWAVLRAEVEAVHGRRFDGATWLQRYFEERYWYRADPAYEPSRLSEIERRNLALIDSLVRAQGASALAACELGLYEARPVTLDLLRGASFATLRILRNEIYARHGMTFRAPALRDWFLEKDWYLPRDTARVWLSSMEQRNVATIAAYERALRDSLRTTPLDPTLLSGLFSEDARHLRLELYARHGRVFPRRWEQDYVASLPGYHPDPAYSDARLSDAERENIATLVAYEKTAPSELDPVEG